MCSFSGVSHLCLECSVRSLYSGQNFRSGLLAQSDLQNIHSAHNSIVDFCAVYLKGKAKYLKGTLPFPTQHSFVYYPAPQIPGNSVAASAQQEHSVLGFYSWLLLPCVVDQKVPSGRKPGHLSVVLPSSQTSLSFL